MTGKRFKLIGDTNIEFLLQDKILLPVYDNGKQLSLKNTVDLLNEVYEENQDLKKRLNLINEQILNKQKERFRMSKKIKDILDKNDREYYCNSPYENIEKKLFGNHHIGINCTDFDDEELNNKLKVKYIKDNIMRKATPEEMEWIRKQEPVTDPEVLGEILPVIKWLEKYGAFDD